MIEIQDNYIEKQHYRLFRETHICSLLKYIQINADFH